MSVLELDISTSPEALFRAGHDAGGAFWFDGLTGGGATFMGFAPAAQLFLRADGVLALRDARGERTLRDDGDVLRAIERFVGEGEPLAGDDAPPHVVGFFAYDLVGRLEPRVRPRRDGGAVLPLAHLARYDAVVATRAAGTPDGARSRALRVHARTRTAAERCAAHVTRTAATLAARPAEARARPRSTLLEGLDEERHVAAVRRALDYIAAGDVYQVNLAQRLRVQSDAAPFDVFRRMCAAQPIPFALYLDCGAFAVLCGSPERFVRVRGAHVATEPIKGTRPRGSDPDGDAALREELWHDAKERAEHVMIVDLERNDLGRVCTPGSVVVPSLMRVESFATLHHMVSTVHGELKAEVGVADLLRATFPGGSVTGAPKIRAAQVIAELERTPREVYTGGVFWFRGPRDFDSAITIRTAIARDGVYTYHAGGGIVADSDPLREHRECLLKAAPFLGALEVARAECDEPASCASAELPA